MELIRRYIIYYRESAIKHIESADTVEEAAELIRCRPNWEYIWAYNSLGVDESDIHTAWQEAGSSEVHILKTRLLPFLGSWVHKDGAKRWCGHAINESAARQHAQLTWYALFRDLKLDY